MKAWKIGVMSLVAVLMVTSMYMQPELRDGWLLNFDARPIGLVAAGYFVGKWYVMWCIGQAAKAGHLKVVPKAETRR